MPKVLRRICFLFLLTLSIPGFGQGYFWESGQKKKHYKYIAVDAGLGLRMYTGDIQGRGSLFNPVKLAYGLGVRYQYSPRIGIALHGAGRGYKGEAEHGGFPDAIDQMSGSLWEGSLMLQYNWLRWEDFTKRMFTDRDPVTKGNAFIATGIGAAQFSASYSSRKYVTQTVTDSLGNQSNVYIPVDNSGSGAGIAIHVPVVLGFRYRFNPSWYMAFETHYDIYFSDNLDGLKRSRNDGMSLFMLKAGYLFGQDKKKGAMGLTPNQRKKLKK